MNQNFIKTKLLFNVESFFKKIKDLDFPVYIAENHPHILNKLYLIWGNHIELKNYLISLTLMNNQQQGFHPPAFTEIVYLQSFYENLYPESNDKIGEDYKSHQSWANSDLKFR